MHGTDRRIRGSFGVAPGAYDRPGKTDGVDFSIEFLGLDGCRQILFHRYLNPGGDPGDRGMQEFDVALPDSDQRPAAAAHVQPALPQRRVGLGFLAQGRH